MGFEDLERGEGAEQFEFGVVAGGAGEAEAEEEGEPCGVLEAEEVADAGGPGGHAVSVASRRGVWFGRRSGIVSRNSMSFALLRDLIHAPGQESWAERNSTALNALFGGPSGRYPKAAAKATTLRAPEMKDESNVPFAAYIHPSNPSSGPYSGLSFVMFPVAGEPCLIGLVVGTQGLAPDEAILGRPGHARKARAICSWLNARFGKGNFVAWAKDDPTRTDVAVPDDVKHEWGDI